MPLGVNALCTLADAKDHLGIPLADTSFDARVERYINAASQLIESHCDRRLVFASYDVRRDGRRSDRLVLPEFPVVAVTKVWDDTSWTWTSQMEIPADEWTVEDEMFLVLRSRRFARGNQNVRVQFTAGYRSPNGGVDGPLLPATLSYACLMTVEWLDSLRQDRRLGVSSKGKNGESVSFSDVGIPPQIANMLTDFVRIEVPLSDALTGNA